VRTLVERFREAHQIPGLAIAVGHDSAIVWSEEVGVADLSSGRPVAPDTKFRIGAISMALTSVALGLLIEEGSIKLDADIRRYVESFPEKRYPVTVGQVAGHTGGIRHYQGDEFHSNRRYPSVLEGLAIFARDSLVFEPGTRYGFSTFGWSLIAAAIEDASGQNFLEYLRAAVLDPLKLTNTLPERSDVPIDGLSTFYVLVDGELREAAPVDNSYKWAGGGYVSTAADLVRFGLGLLAGTLLDPETVALLWRSQRTRDGSETGYGLGWSVGRDADERRVVSHTGGSVGARSMLLVYPDERLAIAITTNLQGVRFGGLPQTIARHFLDGR
jgi:CubicO group peptidase (beta-lactamase class C family)